MVDVAQKKEWSPNQVQAADALAVNRGQPELQPEPPAASVPRKAISLGDFQNVKRDVDESKDYLYVPKELIPDGISIEWKRVAVLNKPDPKHMAETYRAAWRYVPADSSGFAEHFASFKKGDIFEYEGLALMYRPLTMTKESLDNEKKKAGAIVQDKFAEIGLASPEKDIPGRRFKLERGFEEKLPGGNPAAVSVPE